MNHSKNSFRFLRKIKHYTEMLEKLSVKGKESDKVAENIPVRLVVQFMHQIVQHKMSYIIHTSMLSIVHGIQKYITIINTNMLLQY